MAISNEKIIEKMMEELKSAKENEYRQSIMMKHIEKVHVLCELFLESDEQESSSSSIQQPTVSTNDNQTISPAEMKAMLGETKQMKQTKPKNVLDDDDANGDSIFDF